MAIETSLILVFRVTGKHGCRKDNVSVSLDRNSAEFKVGPFCHLCLAVQIIKFSEEINVGLFLKVHFTKDLKIADVGN